MVLGAEEQTPPAPLGEYAMSCLGRERIFSTSAAAGEPGRSPYVFRPNGWQSSRIRRYVSADAFPGLGLGESGKENLEETHKVPGAGRKVLRKEKLKSDQLT